MTADTAASLVDHLKALLARVPEGTTPGPWMWWTSNSWRRLHHEERGLRTSVLEPFVARDGHPDCSVSRDDMALIELAPDIAAALRTAIATISDLTNPAEIQTEAFAKIDGTNISIEIMAAGAKVSEVRMTADRIAWSDQRGTSSVTNPYVSDAKAIRAEALRDVIALCERSPTATAAEIAVTLSNFLFLPPMRQDPDNG